MSQHGSKQPRRGDPAVTKQALQDQWKRLELKPATLLHLQELLDTAGLMEACLVTDVLSREKRPPIAAVSKEWGFTELRLISLEGVRPHLMEGLRFSLETLMAWHLIHFP